MSYDIKDAQQFLIGGFVSIMVFFAIRGGNPFYFNPKIGFIITFILFWIYYNGFRMQNKQLHFTINIILAFAISVTMAVVFGLIDAEQIFTFDIFGSLAIVGTWIAFPSGLLYDRYDLVNPMKRNYIRGKH